MASSPTSKLRFLDPSSGALTGVPREWSPALVEILVPHQDWEKGEVRLWRHGEALPVYLKRLNGQVRVLADWPRSGPGHYRLRLELSGGDEAHTFTIQPTKISPEAYAQLLQDLETRLPAAVAIGLQRTGALSGIELQPAGQTTLEEELIKLRRAVLGTLGRPGLTKVLRELAQDPHRVLEAEEFWVSRERARKPHPARLVQALSRGHNVAADGRPKRVLDTRVEHTADVYENRMVNTYFQQVELRLRRLSRALEAWQHIGPLTEVQALLGQVLRSRRQASFLDKVGLLTHLPTRLTMVLLRRQPYRAALEGYLEFHRSASVRLEEPALEAPLRNLPHLYQVWGTLEVLSALLEVAVGLGYQVKQQRLVKRDAGGFYVRVLPAGQPTAVLKHPAHDTTVRLFPERTYAGTKDWLHSISYRQIPDVAVEVQQPKNPPRLYLFDPKYKLEGELLEGEGRDGRPKKVDIDKMHAYRDAIRDQEDGRVVQHAAILYPGPTVFYAEGIEALHAYPGSIKILEELLRKLFQQALKELT